MPRPRRPHRLTGRFFDFDDHLAEAAAFEPDDPRVRVLQDASIRAVDHYCRHVWHPNPVKGRREAKGRDELVAQLAKAFHDHSNWDMKFEEDASEDDQTYAQQYRLGLRLFVALTLIGYEGIPLPPLGLPTDSRRDQGLLKQRTDRPAMIPRAYRRPRDTRTKPRV